MEQSFLESVLQCVNDVRSSADVPELLGIEESELNFSFAAEVLIIEEVHGGLDEDGEKVIIFALQRLLSGDQDADEQTNLNYRALLNSYATHLFASIDAVGEGFSAKFLVVNKYLELDPVGPIIGGDIVLQGNFITPTFGPALCKVDYLPDNEDDLVEVVRVYPWDMIITHADSENEHDSFAIPVQINPEFRNGTLRFSVYVDEVAKIPYGGATEDVYNPNIDDLIYAIEYTSQSADDKHLNKQGVPAPRQGRIVSSIQIVMPGEDRDVGISKGFLSAVMALNKYGIKADDVTAWPYHMYVSHDSLGEEGVEDIIWVRTPKLAGILTEVPDGYQVIEDGEFSDDSDELSVTLAVKTGPDAIFTNVFMVACGTRSRSDADRMVSKYLHDCGGGEYRPAPPEVCNALGQVAGIIMITGCVDSNDGDVGKERVDVTEDQVMGALTREDKDEDNMSNVTNSENGDDDDDDDLMYSNEQDALNGLTKRLNELETEKERCKQLNLDVQKKCAALLAKLDRSGAGPRMSESATEGDLTATDNNSEKENHFIDTLQNIQESRSKLSKQQSEFDQLNQDLQTRLDDKEFKANEIAESFKSFKQDVLRRSEHSRTGRGVSQKLIEQFELADQNKDQDLEKVRLRYISTRTQLRKLEKNLRAREQLAEGLHMIDFEQLKIENQTLNEKIEERNEELAKLKRKKTNTVQVLTHFREKLRFVEQNNEVLREELEEVEGTVAKQRSYLNTNKHEKDAVRADNAELRRRQGFATNDMLTADFEIRKGTLDMVKASIKELQERHFLLTRQITVNTEKSKKKLGTTAGITLPSIQSKMF